MTSYVWTDDLEKIILDAVCNILLRCFLKLFIVPNRQQSLNGIEIMKFKFVNDARREDAGTA